MTSEDTTPWVKARASDQGSNCIEQRRHDGMIEVRDTKDHGTGLVLRFTYTEYAAWLDGAAKGEFNFLLDRTD